MARARALRHGARREILAAVKRGGVLAATDDRPQERLSYVRALCAPGAHARAARARTMRDMLREILELARARAVPRGASCCAQDF